MLPVKYFKSMIYFKGVPLAKNVCFKNKTHTQKKKIKHTISKDINRKPGINHIKYQCFYENPAKQ